MMGRITFIVGVIVGALALLFVKLGSGGDPHSLVSAAYAYCGESVQMGDATIIEPCNEPQAPPPRLRITRYIAAAISASTPGVLLTQPFVQSFTAHDAAMSQCRLHARDCQFLRMVHDVCLAVSFNARGQFTSYASTSEKDAREQAVNQCQAQRGGRCDVRSNCATPLMGAQ